MRLDGRRESNNVEDRRGMGGGKKTGIGGIGGIILVAVIAYFTGQNPLEAVLHQVGNQYAMQDPATEQMQQQFSPEEEELAKFSRQVLAGTEDVWTELFQEMGRTYTPPKLVLFTNSVNSACGSASSAVGPFYCSADQKLYIDLSFFLQMKRNLGADGDFAYAYVIAHEVGHHVENLLGILGEAHSQMNGMSKTEANKVSVRLELLADYYAGVWAHHDQARYGSLEEGDFEEAIDCAEKIGDNYLQEKAHGHSQPDSFTHGTSEQRMRWFKLGFDRGDMSISTFNQLESEL